MQLIKRTAVVIILGLIFISAGRAENNHKKFVLVLDPGHTPEKPGAISARGLPEREFNLALTQLLVNNLSRDPGLAIIVTNRADQSKTLEERVEIANSAGADLFLSIHHDSAERACFEDWVYKGKPQRYCDRYHGYSLFISKKKNTYRASYCFAERMGSRMQEQGFAPALHHRKESPRARGPILVNRQLGIYLDDDLVVLRETAMPAALIEYGVIVNRTEERMLGDWLVRMKLAAATVRAIEDYQKQCRE